MHCLAADLFLYGVQSGGMLMHRRPQIYIASGLQKKFPFKNNPARKIAVSSNEKLAVPGKEFIHENCWIGKIKRILSYIGNGKMIKRRAKQCSILHKKIFLHVFSLNSN